VADTALERTPAAAVRKLYEDNVGTWTPYWDAMGRELAFLDGERYERDHGPEQRDRRLTQIRGQETQDTIRHMAAEAMAQPRSVEARPVDHDTDPDAAEVELALVEQELANPWKGFEARYYEAVQSSREQRLGVVWADWEPQCGPYGEILYSNIPPTRIMWDAAYDPHHPMCGWLLIKRRLDVDWIHANYKGSDWVKPDSAMLDPKERVRENVPIIQMGNGHSLEPQAGVTDNKAELWFCWYKNDRTKKYRDTGKDLELEPDQRYLACANGCGYRSPTEGELREQTGEDGSPKLVGDLPEEIDGCPTCEANGQMGTLKRIDARAEQEQVLAYSRGKRLVIIAPFSAAPDDKSVYDGKWPIPRARSFPGLFLSAYVKAGKPIGPSDVNLMWDQQVASDNLVTMLLQRVFEHRNYWILPAAGIVDYRNQRYNFREDQFNVMYRDQSKATMGPLDVQVLTAPGPDAGGWNSAYSAVQQKLTQYRGVADFGLTPDSSKDLAVGTVERLTQQGNIPIAEYNRRKNQELSKFYGVVSDMIHATYTPRRLARMRIDNIDLAVRMWGDDMPNFDFVVEETPPFTGLEKARSVAFKELIGVIPMSAQIGIPADRMIELFAEINNLPRSIVRKLQRELEAVRMQQEQMAQQQQAALMGGGPGPQDMPPEDQMAALMQGFNGGGVVPQPAS